MNATLEPAPQKANFANIARHLTEAISSGHFSVGALLPTELELCKHYGTSRHTVRAALAELQQLGLVSRRKNVGTRVISAKPRAGFRPSLASVDDLVQFGEEHLRVVQSIAPETVSGELAKELGCGEGSAWLRISTLRMVGDETALPIGWTDVYIDPSYAEIGDLVRASPDALISSLIAERYDRQIAEIHQDVRAFAITDAAMARKLQVEVGASALKILRQYFDAEGEVFEISLSVHPADRFSVSMRLSR
ncbi:GntR family transcriptional regulator [Variovorax saccharolyticus]|uniref:GntR family transcriptional regulator n=1 Tax=Variovorax saccharolyticus TaxID=3053516 RepID=UPI002575992E|nr:MULTISPECIES: GntR family transcriptional regulator [unclassified Variovorax]MDM0021051.1 GntR family transcriptional regulator [Variovorax sp. J22R187]MDM0025410.1 GntR family transcriptional regulator [Variovorax sp. J31P216]